MRLRLLGAAVEVAEMVDVLRGCPRLRLASVSDPLSTRGARRGDRWVRVYAEAGIRAQVGPCHPGAESWVGEAAGVGGSLHVWGCRHCGGTWTTPTIPTRPEASR
jgi:hypothetical protein